MTDHKQILRRVGWVLIVVGLLDVGLMIYCIMNQASYSSSLNVFAVVAGVLLIRSHLGAARFVTSAAAFLFTGLALASVLVVPWLAPWEYTWLTFRSDPVGSAISTFLGIGLLLMLLWIYLQLRLPPVIEALSAAGRPTRTPIAAFALGSALAILGGVLLQFTMKGETAEEAIRRASQQYGSEYDYFVSRIHWGHQSVSATVVGYNEKESRDIEIEWQTGK